MIEIIGGGMVAEISAPHYGQQSSGISPGGAADELAFLIAYILLNRPPDYRALEIIFPPREIVFNDKALFCLSGAGFPACRLSHEHRESTLQHGVVYAAEAGDRLLLSGKKAGLRSYLLVTKLNDTNQALIGLSRGDLRQWFNPYSRKILVTAGPEFSWLNDPKEFFNQTWEIDKRSNSMGIRLSGAPLKLKRYDIISAPVCDGTIQITADGPIILLHQRQTIGGYPRALTVCHESINHLAQLSAGDKITFALLDHDEAIRRQKEYYSQLSNYESYIKGLSTC